LTVFSVRGIWQVYSVLLTKTHVEHNV